MGAFGAAAATSMAELAVLIVQMIAVRKEFGPRMFLQGWRNFLSGAVMFVCVYSLGQLMGPTIQTLVTQIIIGVVVYFLLLFALRDSFVTSGFHRIVDKFTK